MLIRLTSGWRPLQLVPADWHSTNKKSGSLYWYKPSWEETFSFVLTKSMLLKESHWHRLGTVSFPFSWMFMSSCLQVLTIAEWNSTRLLQISCRFSSDKPNLNLLFCCVCVALSIYGFTVTSDLDILIFIISSLLLYVFLAFSEMMSCLFYRWSS